DQTAASDTLGKLYASLGTDVRFEATETAHEDNAATFTLAATWKFGPEKRTEWTYTTRGTANANGDDWTIQWNPTTVAPGLDEGPLSYSTLVPQPAARVLDRTGAELLTQHLVTLVDVAPGADVNTVAALLNPVAPTITPASLSNDLAAAA
ncbi:penicillin-binding protein, partial [Mycobacterium sp. ITM-2017-0098]